MGIHNYETINGSFYKVEIDNPKMMLYSKSGSSSYSMPSGNGMMMNYSTSYTAYYLRKAGEEDLTSVPSSKKKFEELAPYFSDCESVRSAIADRELDFDKLREVVRRYNSCR